MANDAHVVLVDAEPGAGDYARRRLEELERRWSRFLQDSDVSRLNGSPEALLVVSDDTVALLTTMMRGVARHRRPVRPDAAGGHRRRRLRGQHGRLRAAERRRARHAAPAHSRRHPRASLRRRWCPSPPASASTPAASAKDSPPTWSSPSCSTGAAAGALICIGGDLAAAGTPPGARRLARRRRAPARRLPRRLRWSRSAPAGSPRPARCRATWVHGRRAPSSRHRPGDRRVRDDRPRRGHRLRPRRLGGRGARHRRAALRARAGARLPGAHELDGIVTTLGGTTTSTPALQLRRRDRMERSVNPQIWWYLSRSAGIVAWLMLTALGAVGHRPRLGPVPQVAQERLAALDASLAGRADVLLHRRAPGDAAVRHLRQAPRRRSAGAVLQLLAADGARPRDRRPLPARSRSR